MSTSYGVLELAKDCAEGVFIIFAIFGMWIFASFLVMAFFKGASTRE